MPEDNTAQGDDVVTSVIKIDNSEVPDTIRIDSISVTKEVNRITSAKVILIDGDAAAEKFETSDSDLFIPGKEIEILAGYQSSNHSIFKGIIVKHSIRLRSHGGPILIVDCRDKAFKMTIDRKNKYFVDDKKDSDIITEILGTYSDDLTNEVEATDVTHKRVVQYEATDWDFMLARAEVNGKICINEDGKVTIKAPVLDGDAAVSLLYGTSMLELDAEMDARYQQKAIKSKSWSYTDQEVKESEASNPSVSLNGNISPDELADVGAPDTYYLTHGGKIAEDELMAWGNAMWLKHQLAKIRGRVKFKGTHTIKPGMIISLAGIGERFNGNAFVSGVHHTVADGNWTLDAQFGLDPGWFSHKPGFEVKPAGGLLPAIHGLQIGIVTALKSDPDSEHRIKVRLPVISATEDGIWARVCTLDAGNERGSFFLPEINDEVIVGFLNDDPREAVVLGMLNSSAKPAPLTATDDNHEKGFVTRSKIKMIFNDDKKSFKLETPNGKKVTLDEDAGVIKLEDENNNQIVMNSDGIKIESGGKITIKASGDLELEGTNLNGKANASLKMEGSASATVSASGSLTLKGATVAIN